MSMMWIRILFLVSAAYDFVLGAAFLFSGPQLFEQYNVPLPNHWGYIHFCCLMLMIFGLMFLMVGIRPLANRNLIPFGMLLKASYVGATGYYWANGGIHWVFQPFLYADAFMLIAFGWAYFALASKQAES
jgi:hypothetical protein